MLFYTDSYGILDNPIKEKVFLLVNETVVLEIGAHGFLPKWHNISKDMFLSLGPIIMDLLEKNTLQHILSFRKNRCRYIYNKYEKRLLLCDPFLTYTICNDIFVRDFLFSIELNNKRYKNFAKSLNRGIEKRNYKTEKGVNKYIFKRISEKNSNYERVAQALGNYEVKRYFNTWGKDSIQPNKEIFTQIEIRNVNPKYIKFRVYTNPMRILKEKVD
ncbi:MAG: hypothetical protein PHO23_02365 [Candidatus Pacebacteria bacterium]|nr:hypothetical protein [Candidatus Paceibacterota bacterium]